jgi:hypothetical protein
MADILGYVAIADGTRVGCYFDVPNAASLRVLAGHRDMAHHLRMRVGCAAVRVTALSSPMNRRS